MTYPECVGTALKTMSDRLAEDMKSREANDYIFTVQIRCTFPQCYYHISRDSIINVPEHTLQSSYTFTPKIPREEIKEEILKIEENLIKAYETAIMKRYGIKYGRLLERRIEYELKVEKR